MNWIKEILPFGGFEYPYLVTLVATVVYQVAQFIIRDASVVATSVEILQFDMFLVQLIDLIVMKLGTIGSVYDNMLICTLSAQNNV